MKLRVMTRISLPIIMGGLLLTLLFFSARLTAAPVPAGSELSRPATPVVVAGADLPGFAGLPLAELRLYAFNGGAWQPVPYQFDEVTATGVYTYSEDGLLDGNDELVFMSSDAGAVAPTFAWVDDPLAQSRIRYAVQVDDDANDETGWVYVYWSDDLPVSSLSYVAWNETTETITADSYVADFDTESFIGLSDLSINGSGDIVDRQKIRVDVTIFIGPFPISSTTYTEDSLLDLLGTGLTLTLPISGPVRVLGGDGAQQLAFYGNVIDTNLAIDLSDIPIPPATAHVDALRLSLDLLNPATSGLAPARYFDANVPAGVPIDGAGDSVPAAPSVSWAEVGGAWGGLIILRTVDPGNGIETNYYADAGAFDPDDTGDGRAYGDAGLVITEPDGPIAINQRTFVRDSGSSSGAVYAALAAAPLSTTTVAQTLSEAFVSFIPIVARE